MATWILYARSKELPMKSKYGVTMDAVLSLSSVERRLSNFVKFVLAPTLRGQVDPYSAFQPRITVWSSLAVRVILRLR